MQRGVSSTGAVLAVVIAATVAVKAYKAQQQEARRQEKATFYAEAVRAVEDYAETPYRIRRRDGSAQARCEVAQHTSDIKSRISFYSTPTPTRARGRARWACGR
jgi:Tfp pilus assembly protein PilE